MPAAISQDIKPSGVAGKPSLLERMQKSVAEESFPSTSKQPINDLTPHPFPPIKENALDSAHPQTTSPPADTRSLLDRMKPTFSQSSPRTSAKLNAPPGAPKTAIYHSERPSMSSDPVPLKQGNPTFLVTSERSHPSPTASSSTSLNDLSTLYATPKAFPHREAVDVQPLEHGTNDLSILMPGVSRYSFSASSVEVDSMVVGEAETNNLPVLNIPEPSQASLPSEVTQTMTTQETPLTPLANAPALALPQPQSATPPVPSSVEVEPLPNPLDGEQTHQSLSALAPSSPPITARPGSDLSRSSVSTNTHHHLPADTSSSGTLPSNMSVDSTPLAPRPWWDIIAAEVQHEMNEWAQVADSLRAGATSIKPSQQLGVSEAASGAGLSTSESDVTSQNTVSPSTTQPPSLELRLTPRMDSPYPHPAPLDSMVSKNDLQEVNSTPATTIKIENDTFPLNPDPLTMTTPLLSPPLSQSRTPPVQTKPLRVFNPSDTQPTSIKHEQMEIKLENMDPPRMLPLLSTSHTPPSSRPWSELPGLAYLDPAQPPFSHHKRGRSESFAYAETVKRPRLIPTSTTSVSSSEAEPPISILAEGHLSPSSSAQMQTPLHKDDERDELLDEEPEAHMHTARALSHVNDRPVSLPSKFPILSMAPGLTASLPPHSFHEVPTNQPASKSPSSMISRSFSDSSNEHATRPALTSVPKLSKAAKKKAKRQLLQGTQPGSQPMTAATSTSSSLSSVGKKRPYSKSMDNLSSSNLAGPSRIVSASSVTPSTSESVEPPYKKVRVASYSEKPLPLMYRDAIPLGVSTSSFSTPTGLSRRMLDFHHISSNGKPLQESSFLEHPTSNGQSLASRLSGDQNGRPSPSEAHHMIQNLPAPSASLSSFQHSNAHITHPRTPPRPRSTYYAERHAPAVTYIPSEIVRLSPQTPPRHVDRSPQAGPSMARKPLTPPRPSDRPGSGRQFAPSPSKGTNTPPKYFPPPERSHYSPLPYKGGFSAPNEKVRAAAKAYAASTVYEQSRSQRREQPRQQYAASEDTRPQQRQYQSQPYIRSHEQHVGSQAGPSSFYDHYVPSYRGSSYRPVSLPSFSRKLEDRFGPTVAGTSYTSSTRTRESPTPVPFSSTQPGAERSRLYERMIASQPQPADGTTSYFPFLPSPPPPVPAQPVATTRAPADGERSLLHRVNPRDTYVPPHMRSSAPSHPSLWDRLQGRQS